MEALQRLYSRFTDLNSPDFASVNINEIYQNSRLDSLKNPVSREDIRNLQTSLESLSQQKERRLLRGRKRKASFRKWYTFSPRQIIVGDLCFLRQLDKTNRNYTTIAVHMDAFSRLVHLATQRSKTSKATLKSFEKAIAFFTQGYSNSYKLFNADLGSEYKGTFIRYVNLKPVPLSNSGQHWDTFGTNLRRTFWTTHDNSVQL